ncbi:hypothetical protein [Streptomyces sp. NPDC101150]|uniref:hypothetical protein n=1 Tax=Streptomyces sp. NPDC101150 TaxID=3366114 RepID=UPI003830F1D8
MPRKKAADSPKCRGTGWETETVHAGRGGRRREVGSMQVLCLRCLGTCIDPTPDRF